MIDTTLFKNIMAEARHNPDLLDSFSPNQFKSKESLLDKLDEFGLIDSDSIVTIFGSWYGGILVTALHNKVKQITAYDIDSKVIQIAKNRLFPDIQNVEFLIHDVFAHETLPLKDTTLLINTSCEHMKSMNELPSKWIRHMRPVYFAFQSNNMFDIEGHINCVNSMDEFKGQLPAGANIIHEEEIEDDRGIRYMIIGKL